MRKNILCLSACDLTLHGSSGRAHYLIQELTRKYNVTIFNNPQIWKHEWIKPNDDYKKFFNTNVNIINGYPLKIRSPILNYLLNIVPNLLFLRILLRTKSFDIVISYNAFELTFFSFIWKPKKVKLVYEFSDYLPDWFKYKYSNSMTKYVTKIIEIMMNNCIKKSDLTTVGGLILTNYAKSLKRNTSVEMISYGALSQNEKTNQINRYILGIEQKDIVLGFMGTLQKTTKLDQVISILPNLLIEKPSIKILIVGDGEMLHGLKKMSETLNLTQFVKFTGRVPRNHVQSYIELFDIGLIPLDIEWGRFIRPNKFFEYLMAGKPILSTAIPELMLSFSSEEHPYIMYYNDKISLFESVLIMIKNLEDEKFQFHLKNFQNLIRIKYTWNYISKKFSKLMDEIAN